MEIFGMYDTTIYRDEATGYTIFSFKLNEFIPEFETIKVTCKGYFPYSLMCLPLKLVGEKVETTYGVEFQFDEIEPYVRNKKEAIDF